MDFEGNSRSIEEIEVGDDVLARSEFDAAGSLELKRLEEKFVRVAPVMELVVRGQVITTTAEHPFYVAGEDRFIPAGELTLEDQLVDSQGRPIAIDAIRVTDRLITVCNLRVADFHTYFVGGKIWSFDAWVHNASYAPSKAALPRTLQQQRELAHLTTKARSELVDNFDELARELSPDQMRAIADEPWRMQLFFGTALESRVAAKVRDVVRANPDSVLSDLRWTGRTNAPQDFIGPGGHGFDITGNSISSIRSHYARKQVQAVVTYDSIPSDLGRRFVRWMSE